MGLPSQLEAYEFGCRLEGHAEVAQEVDPENRREISVGARGTCDTELNGEPVPFPIFVLDEQLAWLNVEGMCPPEATANRRQL
jgi:hypothetical protein